MDVPRSNPMIGTVARAVTLPIQAINPLAAGDGVITLPLAVLPEPVHKSESSDHHARSGADSGAAGRAASYAAAASSRSDAASGRSAAPSAPAVVQPDTSSVSARSKGFNLYA
jgi:hypothetical protein